MTLSLSLREIILEEIYNVPVRLVDINAQPILDETGNHIYDETGDIIFNG